jgi:hypothetical protein
MVDQLATVCLVPAGQCHTGDYAGILSDWDRASASRDILQRLVLRERRLDVWLLHCRLYKSPPRLSVITRNH